jgi:hypothetical protein
MKKLIAIVLAVTMLASISGVAMANPTTTVYADDQAGWEAAAGMWETEDFTDAILNPGVSVTSGMGYVDVVNGLWWDRLTCPDYGLTTTTWTFADPIYAFGGTWNPGVPGDPGAAIAVSMDGASWVYVGEIPETYINQFWGFVSDVPFTQVLLGPGSECNGAWCETYEMDNMVYSVQEVLSFDKSFNVEWASLAEHVFGEINIETAVAGVVVNDEFPEGLTLIDVSVTAVGGGGYSLSFDEDTIEVTLLDIDEYTISFEAQVTDVLSYDSIIAVNEATATAPSGEVFNASDDLELLPYTDFYKSFEGAWLEGGAPVDQYAVPLGTKVYFLMYIDFSNSLSIDMLDAYVKDNLGGDLMLEYWVTSQGTAGITKLSGKTAKAHLMWEVGDVLSGSWAISDLEVSTDENTGNGNGKNQKFPDGHQEYTETGTHYLNSGATLKFTASDTGFLCSVSSAGIAVEVVE